MFEVRVWTNGHEHRAGFVVESAVRTVVIVLLDPASDALPGLIESLILVEPHLLFFQAAMEPLDVAVAFGWLEAVRRCVMPSRFRVST